ncbi:S-protein homolog 74 [Linum perenne]
MMVAMSMILQATVIFSSLPPRDHSITAHIKNKLSSSQLLYVHCHCTDHDLGDHYVNFGDEFNWNFKSHYIQKNLWQCYLAPDKTHHAYFHVYDSRTSPFDFDLIFEAREDGIYYINQDSHEDEFFSHWVNN